MREKSTVGTTARAEAEVVGSEKVKDIHLDPGELGAILQLIVSDEDGNITERREMKSESFVRQFIELLFIKATRLWTPATIDIRDTGNVVRAGYNHYDYILHTPGAITDVTDGIIIGTGTTAPTINDYAIETLIPHATMNYGAQTFGAPANDAATSQFTITRVFANVSGGLVVVNEIALYALGYDDAARDFMVIRDVIGGGVNVPNGSSLTVNYRIEVTV